MPRRPRPASRPAVRARRHSRGPLGLARRCVSMGSSTVGNLSGGTPGCGAEPFRLLVRDAAQMAMPRASPQPPFRGDCVAESRSPHHFDAERARVRGRDTFQRWSLPLPLPALSPQAGRGSAQAQSKPRRARLRISAPAPNSHGGASVDSVMRLTSAPELRRRDGRHVADLVREALALGAAVLHRREHGAEEQHGAVGILVMPPEHLSRRGRPDRGRSRPSTSDPRA